MVYGVRDCVLPLMLDGQRWGWERIRWVTSLVSSWGEYEVAHKKLNLKHSSRVSSCDNWNPLVQRSYPKLQAFEILYKELCCLNLTRHSFIDASNALSRCFNVHNRTPFAPFMNILLHLSTCLRLPIKCTLLLYKALYSAPQFSYQPPFPSFTSSS